MPKTQEHAKNISEAEEKRRSFIWGATQNHGNNLFRFLGKCSSVQHHPGYSVVNIQLCFS